MQNNNLAGFLHTLPAALRRVPVLVVALALVAATGPVMADDRYRSHSPRFKPSHSSSFNRDYRPQVRHANRNARGHWNRGYNRHIYRNKNSNSNSHSRYINNHFYSNRFHNPRDRDNWSVSLNFGSGYTNWYSTSLFYGTGLYGNTYYPYGRSRTSVIYNQPTVVYVNDSRPVTTRVISRTNSPRTSLLRDIHGDCYERGYDSSGREIRTRLPDSACNF